VLNAIFKGDTADVVQLISLPLEVLGFALAMLEILFKPHAARIEGCIDRFGIKSRSLMAPVSRIVLIGIAVLLGVTGASLGTLGLLHALFRPVSDRSLSYPAWMAAHELLLRVPSVVVMAFALWGSLMLLLLVLWTAHKTIDGLNALSGGHALGTLGLILACLGVSGELYQVITMYLDGAVTQTLRRVFAR